MTPGAPSWPETLTYLDPTLYPTSAIKWGVSVVLVMSVSLPPSLAAPSLVISPKPGRSSPTSLYSSHKPRSKAGLLATAAP